VNAQADTIAAIATPAGSGGVGIVRLSGPAARAIAEAVTRATLRPRVFHFSTFFDDDGAPLDHGLCVCFAGPNSFTGEDVAELHAHGSPVVLGLLLRRAYALGARPARPGEFSERAFLNGKLDLVQAEAVADLVAAGSEAAARAALRSLDGQFSAEVERLRDALVRLRAFLEAALDFPEEEIDFLADPELAANLAALRRDAAALLVATRRGVVLRDGLHVVIAGRPNAGKSSLLNALAQSDRAIVTPIAGTTRDLVRENVHIEGTALTLVDTAGLRESDDPVEIEGIRRARAELARADAIVLVTDDVHAAADAQLVARDAPDATRIVVHNKIDLDAASARSECAADGSIHVWLSAMRGDGVDLLRTSLARLAGAGEGAAGAFSARTRHVRALEGFAARLAVASERLETRAAELAAEELREAQRVLGEITGEYTSDDLLGAIFSTFCIGK